MTTLTCTITKNGRSDEFGRALSNGQSYTGAFDFVRALYMAGYCSVSDDSVFDDDQWPNETAPGNVTAVQNPATGGIELFANGESVLNLLDGEVVSPDAASVPELEPVDFYADLLLGSDGVYLYGKSSTEFRDFVRINIASQVREVVSASTAGWGLVANAGIRSVITTSSPGVIFVAFGNTNTGADSFDVWRSADYGSSWEKVLDLGTGTANSAATDVWVLNSRSFCEGHRAWYLAEYNVNNARVDGAANDAVVLWRSTDMGVTWTVALKWNSAVHTMRHIHVVRAYQSKVYICFGDSDAESGIIGWDEVADISDTAYSALPAQCPAWFGSQAYRVADLLFRGDGYAYALTDSNSSSLTIQGSCGFFRYPLANPGRTAERISGEINALPSRAGNWGVVLPSGHMIFTEETGATQTTGNFNLSAWVSDVNQQRLTRAGVMKLSSSTTGASISTELFLVGNDVYWCQTSLLGKGGAGTAVFRLSRTKDFCGVRPDAIHPVYWIDPVNGADNADAARGYSPSAPFKSVSYALAANRIVKGARVILTASGSETLSSTAEINFDTNGADSAEYTTLEGAGKDATSYGLAPGSSAAQHLYQRAEATNFELKDLHFSCYRDVSLNGQAIISYSAGAYAQKLRLIRARLGSRDMGIYSVYSLACSGAAGSSLALDMIDSELVTQFNGGVELIYSANSTMPVSVTAKNSVFDGAKRVMTIRGSSSFFANNCIVYGQTSEPFEIAVGASNVPVLINSTICTPFNAQSLLNTGGLALAKKWIGCVASTSLTPAGLYDDTSEIDATSIPPDPLRYRYF